MIPNEFTLSNCQNLSESRDYLKKIIHSKEEEPD